MMNAALEASKRDMLTNSSPNSPFNDYEQTDYTEQIEEYNNYPEEYNCPEITIQNFDQSYEDLELNVEEETSRLRPYSVLTQEDIILQQTTLIKKTSELLGVSFSDARVLLKIMKWDSDQLYLDYTDNPEAISKKAGIDPNHSQIVTGKKGKGECLICMEDSNDITTLSCAHGYCKACWKQYLTLEVKEKKETNFMPWFRLWQSYG
jgi:hypothetical protein